MYSKYVLLFASILKRNFQGFSGGFCTSRKGDILWAGESEHERQSVSSACHCFAFFTMVPTAEITVVLEPLALVVTVTTAGSVAVVVRMVGCAIVVTGMAESHLLFLFCASVYLKSKHFNSLVR